MEGLPGRGREGRRGGGRAEEGGRAAPPRGGGGGQEGRRGGQDKAEAGGGGAGGGSASDDGPRENVFAKFFDMGVGSKFYEGGFEDTMTRKEAALILGVRESSTAKRIKEAHRKLLVLNHPDTGGSTHLSGKINEAKELLLKGKKAARTAAGARAESKSDTTSRRVACDSSA